MFLSETRAGPGYGGARGPWRKLSARKYARDVPPIDPDHPRLEVVCKVGTVGVECVPIVAPSMDEVLDALRILSEWAVGAIGRRG